MRATTDPNFEVKKAKTACQRTMHPLLKYFDQCFKIVIVVAVAEIFKRIFRIFYEYIKYSNHYEPEEKLLTITKRSFGMNMAPLVAIILLLFVAFVYTASRGSWPSPYYYTFMPIYWAFMAIGISNSYLNYADWIREPHGLDYAEGMASSYFHGYLNLILPAQNGSTGLNDRIERYENTHQVKFAIKRLFILVPNTFFINSKIESKILKKDGVAPLETIVKSRAGVERPFRNDVYRFTVPINGTYYYVALEGATPLLSFFEASNFQLSTTWQMKEMRREIWLKFHKHLKYLLNSWPGTQRKAELVLYNTNKSDGRPQDIGEVLLNYITNMWNNGEI